MRALVITYGDSVVSLTQRLKSKWPIVKSPTRQNLVIIPTPGQNLVDNQSPLLTKAGTEQVADLTQAMPRN